MTPRQKVLYAIMRRGSAGIKEIVETTRLEYFEAWAVLTQLRRESVVGPPIREGERGRVAGEVLRYRLRRKVVRGVNLIMDKRLERWSKTRALS